MKQFFTTAILCLISHLVSAQINNNTTKVIQSAHLQDEINISISLPQNYKESTMNYPVVFILDGQWFFIHGQSIYCDFTQRNGSPVTPEFIIVGIETPNEKRWHWGMENSQGFIAFLEEESIQWISTNYRTNNERLIFGWETTGGFVLKVLQENPELFEGYIVASPAPLYGSYFKNLEEEHFALSRFLEVNQSLEKFLYIGEGENDYPVKYGTTELVSLLEEKGSEKLQWYHHIFEGLSHQMCAYRSLQEGIQHYYKHYSYLSFHSKAEFEKAGGLPYIENFYKKRAEKYGLEQDAKFRHATRRNLTFLAITENDPEWFKQLMETFESDSLLDKSYAPHLNAYARFYLENSAFDEAKRILEYTITKYPDQAQGYKILGDYYLANKESDQAIKNYDHAIELARQHGDWRLPEFEKALQTLKDQGLAK